MIDPRHDGVDAETRKRADEAAGALLLQDVRRPAGGAGAGEHEGRDLGEVEYVAEGRSRALRELPAPAGARAVVEALVGLYTGPLFRAALHLWVAASNEPQLGPRVTDLEARMGRETHRMAVELLGVDERRPGVRETVQGLLDMARGLGLANLLTDDSARRERVVAQWARLLESTLHD
ncbi:TetR/AcrR family transcriptional regulator [Streptomyces spirodelae]|uniref:TetR/AcrR family transcriptional regulator n=1 Tax=Streptomyces spirodelae TaxID=2812904 RepID=UPI0035586C49